MVEELLSLSRREKKKKKSVLLSEKILVLLFVQLGRLALFLFYSHNKCIFYITNTSLELFW